MTARRLFTAATFFGVLTLAAGLAYAGPIAVDFETTNPFSAGTLSTAQAYAGSQSLYLAAGNAATLALPDGNLGGTVTMMVFDTGRWIDHAIALYSDTVYGVRWGVTNGSNCAGMTIIEKKFLASSAGYGYGNEGNTASWFSPAFYSPSGGRQTTLSTNGGTNDGTGWVMGTEGTGKWTKWIFTFDSTGTLVSMNMDGKAAVTDKALTTAITGIFLYGGKTSATGGLPLAGMYVDDVTWTPVPEPATMGLLGLGLGGLLLRRRRNG